jgi:hypothetical protein
MVSDENQMLQAVDHARHNISFESLCCFFDE